jgi:hypothetical protein
LDTELYRSFPRLLSSLTNRFALAPYGEDMSPVKMAPVDPITFGGTLLSYIMHWSLD